MSWRRYVDLLAVLTAKEFKVRYKRTVLGYAWSLLNPVVYALTYWFAFKAVLNVRIESYFTFLLAGLFPWQWFANTLQVAPNAFVRNATLVKKVSFPRHLLVAAVVLTEGAHFMLCLPIFAGIEIFYSNHRPHLSWLWGVPILTAIQALLIYGLALVVAAFNVFLRDIERLLGMVITVLFYLTPVIYRPDMVPAMLKPWVGLNPLAPVMVAWRSLLLEGHFDTTAVLQALPIAVLCAAAGHWLYARVKWQLAEAL